MDICITGGSGFVGSHLARKLNEKHQVTVAGLNPENAVLELPEGVEREKIDVTDPSSLDFEDYDCVVHLVALSPLKKPSIPYRKIHVEGTRNVVERAEKDDVEKYFHMSALDADKNADTEYLRTKGEAEELVEKSELDYRIFKPSVIFGEGGHFLRFTSKLTTPFLSVLPGKNTLFQPLYVEDIAEMIEESLKDEYSNQKFEIGGPEKIPLGEIAEKIEKSKVLRLKVLDLPMPVFKIAMKFSEHISFSPFGMDQYRSLKTDNTTGENHIGKLGFEPEDLKTLDDYLGLEK